MTSRYSASAPSKRGGMVGLDPCEDLLLGCVGVDLRGRSAAGGPMERQLFVADGQDLVRGQAIERPERDELVEVARVPSAKSSPALGSCSPIQAP